MIYIKVKRCFDILISLTGFIIFLPLLLVICILIKLDSPGPVIFKQDRLGLQGKVFQLYKFRSMYVDAEKGGVYEHNGDLRVTRIGKIIRKTSIDEFPQFINVLKGDMSLIGPRPVLTYHPWPLEQYTREQKKRFLVKPGITGLAQIKGRKNLAWSQRLQYDVEYTNKVSFLFDLKIFLITVFKVITMKDNFNKV